MTLEFTECDACRGKEGGAPLCTGCLRNWAVIEGLLFATTARDQRLALEVAARKMAWPDR